MGNRHFDAAVDVLRRSVEAGKIKAASLFVEHRGQAIGYSFGDATSDNAIFLLASITKPMVITAVMSLAERGLFHLDDRVCKFIPDFAAEGRDVITMRNLMTHVSGLPDQLPGNSRLRAAHAGLDEFVQGVIHTPLLFAPGTRYRYSSMAILLACEVAQRLSGQTITELISQVVFDPLGMKHTALGIGDLPPERLMLCQVETAAAESGAGDPTSKSWDWNSPYWRNLGSPWGGAHGSAEDVAKFLRAFLDSRDQFLQLGTFLQPDTVREMIRNHQGDGIRPHGLGFELGKQVGGKYVSDRAFGHGGSTGTLCWADPCSDTIMVVLTTLPVSVMRPHPRQAVSDLVAMAVR